MKAEDNEEGKESGGDNNYSRENRGCKLDAHQLGFLPLHPKSKQKYFYLFFQFVIDISITVMFLFFVLFFL